MKYWFDTEFIEDGKTIDLMSIGIVAEDGRELYLASKDCNLSKASQWVRDNVVIHLPHPAGDNWAWHHEIRNAVLAFCDKDIYGKPEFWGYYADYDWVALCQLFGTMMDLPKGWPMYCRDIKQFCDAIGNPDLPKQRKGEHDALADARWNKLAYRFLEGLHA